MPAESVSFDIHGYRVRIVCAVESVLSGLADDFAFFAVSGSPDESVVELVSETPRYEPWADAKASAYTPRNVAYRLHGKTVIDYSGRGLGIHDTQTGDFRLASLDHDLLYEAAYLFLLSQSGEALDRVHLHRIHALGVSVNGRAALVLLPMGGGKSTLGSALLEHPEVKILSDDSPLVDREGNLHAFPLRIGLLPNAVSRIPADQLRTIQRMEFGPKMLVNYKYFADRVVASAAPGLVLLGERSLDMECSLRPASLAASWKSVTANCVVGMGLFQGMEFLFGRSAGEMAEKAAVVGSRAAACRRLLARSGVYHLRMGRDIERNAATVLEALKTLG